MIVKKVIPLVFLALMITISGCHPLFCVWDMGYKAIDRVPAKTLIGKYVLTAHSKKMMEYEGNYKHIPNSFIELKSDSTYVIVDAPDWLKEDFGESHKAYFDKAGKWFVSCQKNEGCVFELTGVASGELIYEKKNKMFILLSVGDPDGCQGMVYEKQ